jgi:hypothetical protein
MRPMLSLPITVILFVVSSLLTIGFGFMGARPHDLRRTEPRMVPWRLLMMLAFVVALMMLVHLLNELGFTTGNGRPF